jgi:methyltransferase (TIGR00027 family)
MSKSRTSALRGRDPSATAELIAQSAVFLSRDPRLAPLLPAGAAELSGRFLAAGAPSKLALVRQLSHPGVRVAVTAIERAVLPGIQLHYAVRKRFIEDAARDFLAGGGAQVVVLGAGFDTLASRLAREFPDAAFVEVDHPATQQAKRRVVDATPARNLRLHAADLTRTTVGAALRGVAGFWPSTPTFFVLEGVTMYLSEAAVAATLRSCADAGGAGTRIAWTFMTPDHHGRIAFRRSRRGLVDAWLSARGEPFTWGISPAAVPAFLEPLRLRAVQIAGADELRARYLAPARIGDALAEGESICVAEAGS